MLFKQCWLGAFKLISGLLVMIILPCAAEVITDGSLGAKVELTGKDFQITPELGQQLGGNLFHSFQSFNLNSDESATFSGADSVQNIISRVTGGSPSLIDGTLRSTIPNADLYFINPYGVMFGQNAKLDLQGGFHVSTADYLKLQDGGRFDARNPSNSLLTVAPVSAFGFLTDSPAAIKSQNAKLSVLPEKILSLIGGDILIRGDVPPIVDNTLIFSTVDSKSALIAPQGRINLASIASPGEVIPTTEDLLLQGRGAHLTIENSLVEPSGSYGGAVFIRAGKFFLTNGLIRSITSDAEQSGKGINLKVTEATYLKGIESEITVLTMGTSKSGSIFIETPLLDITGSIIGMFNVGNEAGSIDIWADQVLLKDGAVVATTSAGQGLSGDISFHTNFLSLSGFYPGIRFIHGQANENIRTLVSSESMENGKPGNIQINTQDFNISYGILGTNSSGVKKGGDVILKAQSVRLTDGGMITTATYQTAPAGNVKIQVTGDIHLSGQTLLPITQPNQVVAFIPSAIVSGTANSGHGGNVEIQANKIILTDGGLIGAPSMYPDSTGDAGEVRLKANIIELSKGGSITTSAEHAGGGNITLAASNLLYLHDGQITTSVEGGKGDGGNIAIEQPQFIVLNQAQIKAQADAGHGGNINIVAQHFVPSFDSLISASSNLGIDGKITIASPTEDVGNQVLNLSASFLNASSLFPRSCAALIADQRPSQFMRPFALTVKSKAVIAAPEDVRASHIQ